MQTWTVGYRYSCTVLLVLELLEMKTMKIKILFSFSVFFSLALQLGEKKNANTDQKITQAALKSPILHDCHGPLGTCKTRGDRNLSILWTVSNLVDTRAQ